MSIITGLWHVNGGPLDKERLELVAGYAKQHGPDARTAEFQNSVGMIYQLFDSGTKVSRGPQPHRSQTGTIMMWDGRLDNRNDILAALDSGSNQHRDGDAGDEPSDIEILHALYDRYGAEGFRRIVGDWALSVWDPNNKRLTMACDFVGIRHLYYCKLQNTILWCSDLGALVRGAGRSFTPNDAYIAEYLEALPHPSRTPYEGVEAVLPGHWVEATERKIALHRYWSWDVSKPIRYKSDGEYEEHFRHELRRAVKRRLESDYPVVAELSGGLDSSSIVCMADDILGSEGAATSKLHTLSYYHEEEPGCDERPYSSIVERKRDRVGTHINVAPYDKLTIDWPIFVPVPTYPHGIVESESELWKVLRELSARTVLSGVGGDEFLGSVPTAVPELADLVRARELGSFGKKLSSWSKASRESRWELTYLSLKAAFTFKVRDVSGFSDRHTSLISPALTKGVRSGKSNRAEVQEWLVSGAQPSQRIFVEAWAALQRQFAYMRYPLYGSYRQTYPFLDRDLLTFLINIPRTQIIRVGERRSLMRRSLAQLVPQEILWRKNKAVSSRRYMRLISRHAAEIRAELISSPLCPHKQYIDPLRAEVALSKACNGFAAYEWSVMRMIGLQSWLKSSNDFISDVSYHSEGRQTDCQISAELMRSRERCAGSLR